MSKIGNTSSTHTMQTEADHYNHQIPLILKERDQNKNYLTEITNNEQLVHWTLALAAQQPTFGHC